MESIKEDLLNYQDHFLQYDASLVHVEIMWNEFKEALRNTMLKHIPQRTIQSNNDLPWINKEIENDTKTRKR